MSHPTKGKIGTATLLNFVSEISFLLYQPPGVPGRLFLSQQEINLAQEQKASGGNTHYCAFCGFSQHEVRMIIVSTATLKNQPNACICDGCVELCVDIIKEKSEELLKNAPAAIPQTAEVTTSDT